MNPNNLPGTIPNWINGEECAAISKETFDNVSPDTGRKLCDVARSGEQDVQNAIQAARRARDPCCMLAADRDFTALFASRKTA